MGKREGALCYWANLGQPAWHLGRLLARRTSWASRTRASSPKGDRGSASTAHCEAATQLLPVSRRQGAAWWGFWLDGSGVDHFLGVSEVRSSPGMGPPQRRARAEGIHWRQPEGAMEDAGSEVVEWR
jgi:hypothetical protein